MSSLTLDAPAHGSSVVEQIACCVEDLGAVAGLGCLVETPAGRLVAHHLRDTTPTLVTALVSGELGGLHRELSDRRTTGLLPTGPVVEGVLGGLRAAFLALRDQDRTVGGVWLLLANGPLSLEVLREPVQRLTELLACTTPDVPALSAILDGAALPPELASCDRFWVARLTAEVPASELLRSLRRTAGAVTLVPLLSGHQVYFVAAGTRRIGDAQVLTAVQKQCDVAAARLRKPVTAGISFGGDSLVPARAQADLAASAVPVGACASLSRVRSVLVARHLAGALDTLPDLGTDPLACLRDYDRRRTAGLVDTLRAWLDVCGDVTRATEVLGVHSNTLRYRLRRIEEITGLDLRQDASARLELQLRLLATD